MRRNTAGQTREYCGVFALAGIASIAIGVGSTSFAGAVDFVSLSPVTDGNSLTDDRGRANTDINTVPFKRSSLTTVGGYQFTSYYHFDGTIVVGRRSTGEDQWDLFRTEFTSFNINDAHNTSSIAVDGNGMLHMSWGMHGDDLLYTRSTGSVLNNGPIELIGDAVGNSAAPNSMTGAHNSRVTYPEFYELPDGDLLFTYRNGGSGNGDYRLRRFDTQAGAWSELGLGDFDDIWLGARDPASSLPTVNAYPNQLAFDSEGNIHATWTWRTGGDSTAGQSGYQTNHHISYARSPDEGATWTTMDDTPYTTPIYETNAEVAVHLPEGSSLINTTGMAVDQLDQPVLASWWAPNAQQNDHQRQYMLAWYDRQQSRWRTSQISNRTVDDPMLKSEAHVRDLGRPIVVVDDENRVIVAYRDNQDTNGLSIAYSESTDRDDWQHIELTTADLGVFEPTYDINRWQQDGVLSMLYQPVGQGRVASQVSVLEWDARSFFADLNESKLTLLVDRNTGNLSITNTNGDPIAIDGYSIRSATGSLDPNGWKSFDDQLIEDWRESNPSAIQLVELKPTGESIFSSQQTLSLGAAFGPHYPAFGVEIEDLQFQFSRSDGTTVHGLVEYTGSRFNNLVLMVDATTGVAELHNTSDFEVQIDGYAVSSPSGSLLPSDGNWLSLDDQDAAGGDWRESNADAFHLAELKPSSVTVLTPGEHLSLGRIFDATGGTTDLALSFLMAGTTDGFDGKVAYVSLGLPGDYNGDGTVNAADYVVWRDSLGQSGGGLVADGNGDGVVGALDFDVWSANYGLTVSAAASRQAATPLPEPATFAIPLPGLMLLLYRKAPVGLLRPQSGNPKSRAIRDRMR